MKTILLTAAEFNDLPEYSCSLPTGTTIGKRWKQNRNAYAMEAVCPACGFEGRADRSTPEHLLVCPHCQGRLSTRGLPDDWRLGEYYDPGPPDNAREVGIHWFKIIVQPRCLDHPDDDVLRNRDGPGYFCLRCGKAAVSPTDGGA